MSGPGEKGRSAFPELVLIAAEIRMIISERQSAQEISQAVAGSATSRCVITALKKVLLGLSKITCRGPLAPQA